ncbi:MAG: hypothetical protein ACPGXY_05965 [Alphaproteobacteria bacterium]
MSHKTPELWRILVVVAVVVMGSGMLWMHRQAVISGIFTDFGIEPFEVQSQCAVTPMSPALFPSTLGQ